MSHTVTVTRTTTSTTTSAIILNTGYLKTAPGLLKLAQVILGAVILGIYIYNSNDYQHNYTSHRPIAFFISIATTFFLASLLLLLSCLISISTGAIIAKTTFEFIYHGGAFLFYIIASCILLYDVNEGRYNNYNERSYYIISVLGLINSILYIVSAVFAYKSYKGV
ncbi:hypothetical protein WDU94_006022 [Cyamophila willieti]